MAADNDEKKRETPAEACARLRAELEAELATDGPGWRVRISDVYEAPAEPESVKFTIEA
jgi:hypothetical protein